MDQHVPDEGWKAQKPKLCNNNKYEENHPNVNNANFSCQKLRQKRMRTTYSCRSEVNFTQIEIVEHFFSL